MSDTTKAKHEMAMNLRIIFLEAIELVPAGLTDKDDIYRWELFLSDKMLDRVMAYIETKDLKIQELEEIIDDMKNDLLS